MHKFKLLKIKIKSLAAEARLIRYEERRSHGEMREELHNHRVVVVRRASRLTQIAYARCRDRDVAKIDSLNGLTETDWKDINRMICRYGDASLVFVRPTWGAGELQSPQAAGSIPAGRAA